MYSSAFSHLGGNTAVTLIVGVLFLFGEFGSPFVLIRFPSYLSLSIVTTTDSLTLPVLIFL